MLSLLVPFWVWILLGIVLGWMLRGWLGRKFGFLNRLRRTRSKPAADGSGPKKEEGLVGRITGFLARPIERWMGDDKEKKE